MSPEVHRLFEAACVLSPEQRTKYIQSQTTDAEVQREVLSLLAHDAVAEPFFAEALESAVSSVLLDLDLRSGTRIGSFTIEVLAAQGDYSGARAMYREGLQIAEQLPKGPSMLDPAPLIASLRTADSRAASAIASRTH